MTQEKVLAKSETQEYRRYVGVSDLYQLLALLLGLPTAETVQTLREGMLETDIRQIVSDIGFDGKGQEALRSSLELFALIKDDDKLVLSELRIEYTRLFAHPDHPAVNHYECLFLYWESNPLGTFEDAPRLFVSASALDAERQYRRAGFTRSPTINEPADSMTTELEFMHNLYATKAALLGVGKKEDSAFLDECIEEFSRIHLQKWAVNFFGQCAEQSKLTFFRAVGLLGKAFMVEMLSENQRQLSQNISYQGALTEEDEK